MLRRSGRKNIQKMPFSPSTEENRNTSLKKRSAERAYNKNPTNPKKQKSDKPSISSSFLTINKENNANYSQAPWDPSNDDHFEFNGFIESDDDSSSLTANRKDTTKSNHEPSTISSTAELNRTSQLQQLSNVFERLARLNLFAAKSYAAQEHTALESQPKNTATLALITNIANRKDYFMGRAQNLMNMSANSNHLDLEQLHRLKTKAKQTLGTITQQAPNNSLTNYTINCYTSLVASLEQCMAAEAAAELHNYDVNSTPSRTLLAGLFGKPEADIISSNTITSIELNTIFEEDEMRVNHNAVP